MYTIYELHKKSNVSIAILQRYRNIGVLVDKFEVRTYKNALTKGLNRRKVIVYDENELNLIIKFNFILFNNEIIRIPKDIDIRILTSKLKNDNYRKNEIEKYSYWLNLYKNDIKMSLKKHQIVVDNKKIFFYDKSNSLYQNTSRMDEICNLLLQYEKIENIPGFPKHFSLIDYKLWMFFGFDEENAKKNVSYIQQKNSLKFNIKKKQNPLLYKNINTTQKMYWITKGYSEEESIKLVSERQKTFSKQICIEKYGNDEGIKRWKCRQKKWQSTIKNKPLSERILINSKKMFKKTYSKISQQLFVQIYDKIKIDFDFRDIFFATFDNVSGVINDDGVNKEYFIKTRGKVIKYYDFFIKSKHLIIEFDGDYWHNIKSIKNVDKLKEKIAKKYIDNVKILRIIESDYRNNPELTIKKCLEFIYE